MVETIEGLSTIRAFGWSFAIHQKYSECLDLAQRPFYMLFCIQQWLALVLDLIIGAMAVILVSVAVSVTGSISAGDLGVTLVLMIQFNTYLSQSIQSWTRLETSIGAVARIQQFIEETPVEPSGTVVPEANWPSRGGITFESVAARYK